jgi:hypothetical protein
MSVTAPLPRTTISFDTWSTLFEDAAEDGDDEFDGGIYSGSDGRAPRVAIRVLKQEFWSEYDKFLKSDNFAALFSLADRYRKCLRGEICFDPILGRALPHAKQASDFDRIRRIAQIGELFHPATNSFARIVQAYCYLATGHEASAYAIVKIMDKPLTALAVASKSVEEKQPAVSKQLNELREFFEAADNATEKESDHFHNLKI